MSKWLTYSPVSGHGNTQITLSASTLTGLEDRIAALIATGSQEWQMLSATTVITQKHLTLTEIYFKNLTWVTDVSYIGGTATSANCSFSIIAKYSDNSTEDITNKATISGSLVVPATTATARQSVGTLTLKATYDDKTCTGSVTAYQEAFSFSKEPLTFNIISGGTIVWKSLVGNMAKTISYSKDDGITWTNINATTAGTPISVSTGDIVKFKGDNTKYSRNLFGGSAVFSVEGNIMSLIDSEGFATATTLDSELAFNNIFGSCTGLTSAENLMLPATTLASGCYSFMFANCTSLTTPPKLPATTLATSCYDNMFAGCTSLIQAPVLPATTLAGSCYNEMFQNCTSLTTAPSILPATTLAGGCYYAMFGGCTSLTVAPELPATTLTQECYGYMFYGCTSLNYIKCLATDVSAKSYTIGWVEGVSSTGTFVKASSMTSWPTGVDGIPEGWTVVNDS